MPGPGRMACSRKTRFCAVGMSGTTDTTACGKRFLVLRPCNVYGMMNGEMV